jgi:hypothetical protein
LLFKYYWLLKLIDRDLFSVGKFTTEVFC